MGAQRNIPLAGDAARRMYPGKRSGANPQVVGENLGRSANTIYRQEITAGNPSRISALETQDPSFSQGITTDPSTLGRMAEGAPEREQVIERLRGMRNTGGRI